MRGRLYALSLVLAAGIGLAAAPSASATFHLIQVREVYPGSLASPESEYVELQMWASGQNLVAGHVLRTYDASGAPVGTNTFSADVPRGGSQSTILLATPQAEAQLAFAADAPLSPGGQLDPAGGAVCWEAIDCVSWGGFSGSVPSPSGSPAAPAGIPDGMALQRKISPAARPCSRPATTATTAPPTSPSSSRHPAPTPFPRASTRAAPHRAPRPPPPPRRRFCAAGPASGPAIARPPSASPPTSRARASSADSTLAASAAAALPSPAGDSRSAATPSACAPATARGPPTPPPLATSSGCCAVLASGR